MTIFLTICHINLYSETSSPYYLDLKVFVISLKIQSIIVFKNILEILSYYLHFRLFIIIDNLNTIYYLDSKVFDILFRL